MTTSTASLGQPLLGELVSLDAELVSLWINHDGQVPVIAHDCGAQRH